MSILLLLIGAASVIIWGIAHLFPTKNVVADFGDITEDNIRIITMEWVNEGLTLIFIGCIVLISALVGTKGDALYVGINLAASMMLVAMSVLSYLTGFKIDFLPFKLCPAIFTGSAVLILLGTFI